MIKKTNSELQEELNRQNTTSEISKACETVKEWALKTFANKNVEAVLIWAGTIIGGALIIAAMQLILK